MTAERIAELRRMVVEVQPRAIAEIYQVAGELLDAAERLVTVQAELDVLRGVVCEEGQAMGRGRCGACVCCLRAACARKDALLGDCHAMLWRIGEPVRSETIAEEIDKR